MGLWGMRVAKCLKRTPLRIGVDLVFGTLVVLDVSRLLIWNSAFGG